MRSPSSRAARPSTRPPASERHEIASRSVFDDFLADKAYGIKGNGFANEITAAGHNDLLHGLSGNDTIYGENGADKLFGDDGIDRLIGGTGDEFLTAWCGRLGCSRRRRRCMLRLQPHAARRRTYRPLPDAAADSIFADVEFDAGARCRRRRDNR